MYTIHTQTHTNTHKHRQIHTHACPHTDTCTQTQTYTHTHTHTQTHTHEGKVQIITVTYCNNYGDGCSAQNRQVIKGLWLALLHSYSVCTMYSA